MEAVEGDWWLAEDGWLAEKADTDAEEEASRSCKRAVEFGLGKGPELLGKADNGVVREGIVDVAPRAEELVATGGKGGDNAGQSKRVAG